MRADVKVSRPVTQSAAAAPAGATANAPIALDCVSGLSASKRPATEKVHLQVRTFGGLQVRGPDGWRLGPPAKKGGDLIQLLVTYPTGLVSKEKLVTDTDLPDGHRRRLYAAASGARTFLRACLGGIDGIRATACGYAWHERIEVDSDLALFIDLRRTGTLDAYKRALDLYTGEFLLGQTAEWIRLVRVLCASMYLEMLERVGEAAYAEKHFCDALQYGLSMCAADRGHELGSRLVMRSLAALGQRNLITGEYEALRKYLDQQLGAKPSSETVHLYYALLN